MTNSGCDSRGDQLHKGEEEPTHDPGQKPGSSSIEMNRRGFPENGRTESVGPWGVHVTLVDKTQGKEQEECEQECKLGARFSRALCLFCTPGKETVIGQEDKSTLGAVYNSQQPNWTPGTDPSLHQWSKLSVSAHFSR